MMTCSYGGWDGACPFPRLCDGTGCVECPSGNHVCASGMGYYYRTCPAGKKCHSSGCVSGEDPDNPYLCPTDPPPACPPPLPPPPARPPLPPRELWDCHGITTCREGDYLQACGYPYLCGGGDATRARPEITSANATGATFMGRGRAQPAQNAIPQGAWQPRTTLTTHTPARTRRRRPAPHRCRRATLTVTACPTPTRAHMLASIRCIALSAPPLPHRTLSASPVPTRTRRRADLLAPVRTLPAGPAPLLCARAIRGPFHPTADLQRGLPTLGRTVQRRLLWSCADHLCFLRQRSSMRKASAAATATVPVRGLLSNLRKLR